MKRRVLAILLAVSMVAVGIPTVAGATDTEASNYEEQLAIDEATGESAYGDGTSTTSEGEAQTTTEDAATPAATEQTTPEGTEVTTDPTTQTEVLEGENLESDNVVTLGENLTEEQRKLMYEYFGTSADKVRTIIVTHEQEVAHMQGIATAEQIGNTTNSCAYVEPTESGGIKVKTANLTYVTSQMIASTLTTAGIKNANVVAACPFAVSGTGALTGIMMAYETASGDKLEEGKKEAAIEELMTTTGLAESIGSEEASEIINEAKTEILDQGITDPEEIGEAVDKIAAEHDVTLDDSQRQQVIDLMSTISQYDYDLDSIQKTLENINGTVGALQGAWENFKSFFVGSDDGILSETNDDVLGGDVQTTSTEGETGFKEGLLERIFNLFK